MSSIPRRCARAVIVLGLVVSPPTTRAADTIGVFFDEQATIAAAETTIPNEPLDAWLVALDPSLEEGIGRWECVVEARTPGPPPAIIWQLAGQALNVDAPPRFQVVLVTPLPPAPVVVLATARIYVPDPAHEVAVYLHAYDPPSLTDPPGGEGYPVTTPACGDAETMNRSLLWTSGCETAPVALINDDGTEDPWELAGIPGALYIDGVPVGQSGLGHFFLANPGTVAVSGTIALTGSDFLYRHSLLAWGQGPHWVRLEPGEEMLIEVLFQPTEAGPRIAYLELDVCGQLITTVLFGNLRDCAVDPPNVDFGEVEIGGYGAIGNFRVTNHTETVMWLEVALDPDCTCFTLIDGEPFIYLGPGDSETYAVRFLPEEIGLIKCLVSLGNEACIDVQVQGVGLPQGGACHVFPGTLVFGEVELGDVVVRDLLISNHGEDVIAGEVSLAEGCTDFAIVAGAGPFKLAYMETHLVSVAFAPQSIGEAPCEVELGNDSCPLVICQAEGVVPTGAADRIGVYFDAPFFEENEVDLPPGTYPTYLVLSNPSATGGIGGWEACLPVAGENAFLGWVPEGEATNVLEPPCFDVDLSTPLPLTAATVLATGELLVVADGAESAFYVTPIAEPTFPDQPAYFNGLTPPDAVPLETVTGLPLVATVNATIVTAPAPTAPTGLRLRANFPNPFNPRTTLRFDLPQGGPVSLAVHDLAGKRLAVLASGVLPAGRHERQWEGRDDAGRPLPSGVYYARLQAGGEVRMQKMTLLQ